MQCSCEREALLRVLTVCVDLCRTFPDLFQVTFAARTAGETTLDVLLWHEPAGIGMWATVPADVQDAGIITVPARTTADALATHPGNQISLVSVQLPAPVEDSTSDQLKPLPAGPALQLESSSAGRKQRTRVRLGSPLVEPTMERALTAFRARGVPLAELSPRALRQAWEPCLLLAKKRADPATDTPDMDHALVLFRFDPDALVCTATTRSTVAQTRLSWTPLAAPVPISHVLVDERPLRWISNALKQESGPVTLSLVPQTASTALLLVTFSQGILMCRAMTEPLPLVWERRVHAPSSQVLVLSRVLLSRALSVFAADREHGADRCLLLRVEGRHLCLQEDPLAQEGHATVCRLPIVNTVQESAPVLVHVRTLREMLRQFKEPVVCLEQGDIRLRPRDPASAAPVPIGFVRLSHPTEKTIQMMMTIADRIPSKATGTIPAEPAPEPSPAETNGDALAPA